MVATQKVPHRDGVDGMPHVRQSTLDAPIAPGGVLLGHLDGELLDLLRHWWPPQLGTVFTPVELLRNQALVPAQQGIKCGDGGQLVQALAPKRVGEGGQSSALGIGETEPATTEPRFQNTVFCEEIHDGLLLVTLEPARGHGDEDLENHCRA